MNRFSQIVIALLVLASTAVVSLPAMGQDQAGSISGDEITELNAKLAETGQSPSEARKKLAIRRVIREGEALLKKHPSAPNRYPCSIAGRKRATERKISRRWPTRGKRQRLS